MAGGLALVVSVAVASRASAYVYWTDSPTNVIQRANNDGTSAITLIQGASKPTGIAVTPQYIFWANQGSGTIGRANIDGTDANPNFITGGDGVAGVAVQGNYVYWTNSGCGGECGIGRANLDGSAVNQNFIPLPLNSEENPGGLAVDANYLYVTFPYYANGPVARFPIAGGNVSGQILVTTYGFPLGIAVNSSSMYFSNFETGEIERANLDGTNLDTNFQGDAMVKDEGFGGIALDSTYIY